MQKKEKVVVLIGPTAVGKTKTSIELAKRFNGEIISGDSMQIYKEMDIGTAKIKKSEMEGITHHLIDIKNPDETFSVAEFQELVRMKITEITNRGKLPMIVGGTGLYIQSAIYDYQFSDAPNNEELRRKLEERVKTDGVEVLHKELTQVDPLSAERIHPNNVRRVIRALEVYLTTGQTLTEIQSDQVIEPLYEVSMIGLTMERERLYDRINLRVDEMITEGLEKEVKKLFDCGLMHTQALQAIGYKEWFPYFLKEQSLEATIDQLKQNSRRYAKRQLTWFRNKMDVTWFDMTDVTNEQQIQKKIMEISTHIEGKLKIKSNTYQIEIKEEDLL
ncbi:tRNA (adenosine(37)-N6)-dimethylallyltransferase MiaA [Robertmurraya korlensis]|uniref:tRNA (adenosine(37)-N6)-dimethylallyltransferase MiaA n=1 Tax=Robertmurraya korlensis TaxID=519977 RepID=UPI000826BBCE|nr:tRNA (adenosine(37)-N6)-dimethylallyltransferase MiaA [Robertmurraya korlensis]